MILLFCERIRGVSYYMKKMVADGENIKKIATLMQFVLELNVQYKSA
jgi:hypothetical protein